MAGIPVVLDGAGNGIKSHRWITNILRGTTQMGIDEMLLYQWLEAVPSLF